MIGAQPQREAQPRRRAAGHRDAARMEPRRWWNAHSVKRLAISVTAAGGTEDHVVVPRPHCTSAPSVARCVPGARRGRRGSAPAPWVAQPSRSCTYDAKLGARAPGRAGPPRKGVPESLAGAPVCRSRLGVVGSLAFPRKSRLFPNLRTRSRTCPARPRAAMSRAPGGSGDAARAVPSSAARPRASPHRVGSRAMAGAGRAARGAAPGRARLGEGCDAEPVRPEAGKGGVCGHRALVRDRETRRDEPHNRRTNSVSQFLSLLRLA